MELTSFLFQSAPWTLTPHKVGDGYVYAANEIANLLGICNASQMVTNIDSEYIHRVKVATKGGQQTKLMLTDEGVMLVIMRSNRPQARPFQKWVLKVIVQVAKTGRYDLPPSAQPPGHISGAVCP